MSYCPCRLIQVFDSIFRQFNWKHVALILDKSDLFSLTIGKLTEAYFTITERYNVLSANKISMTGKNLEIGLYKGGVLSFSRELDGNDEMSCEKYLTDASMHARGDAKRTLLKCY